MKRTALSLILILFVVFGIGFLSLIWKDMRNGDVHQSTQPHIEQHRRRDERGTSGTGQTGLCIWAVLLATKPNLDEKIKTQAVTLRLLNQEEMTFDTLSGLALWATSNALHRAET